MEDYVLEHKDLKKIVAHYIPNNYFKRSLAEFLLRMDYRNTYGSIEDNIGNGETDFFRGYPRNLVPTDVEIPVGTYGFVNTFSYKSYENLGLVLEDTDTFDFESGIEGIEDNGLYDTIYFNVNDMMKEDLIKHFKTKLGTVLYRSDFTLVDYVHETNVFRDYMDGKLEVIKREIDFGEESGVKIQKFLSGSVSLLDDKYGKGYSEYLR